MSLNPKILIIGLGIFIALPFIVWFFIKKPYILVAGLVLGAIILLPIIERKIGLG